MSFHDLIVVGTSAGGVEALRVLAAGLPADFPAAVLVVMHSSPQSPYLLPGILSKVGPLEAVKSVDGAKIEPGKIFVAPPDHHLLVRGNRIGLSKGPKENLSRPAIDPLFRTAAAAYGPRVVGVILTGMLDDGTAGASVVKERGGCLVVQDPKDALYPSMPNSVLRYVGADYTLPLPGIAPLLARLVKEQTVGPETVPISQLCEIESNFAEMETMNIQDMDTIGTQAGVSCPECHGPIWKMKDPALPRYRCHVGHAYTTQAMAQGQLEAQEIHLWQALRLMKERVSSIWEMRAHAQHEQRDADVEGYDARVRQLQKNMERIQEMLREETPTPRTDQPL